MTGRLVLLCGRSFSGKSTIASHLADGLPGRIVSLDAINAERGLHGGDGISVAEWSRTNEIARDRAAQLLRRQETVIVDDTSSPRFLRDAWRQVARASRSAMTLVFIDTPPDVIRERFRRNRISHHRPDLTDQVLADHIENFEPPDEDEYAVGVESDQPREHLLATIKAKLGGST